MERVEKSIEVNRPVQTVYNQWTQFEEFPRFMAGVKEVRQVDDTHVHWHAEIWGKDKEWDAEIIEQVPDQCIAWCSTSGPYNAGVVRFEPRGPEQTCVTLEMAYDPEGVVENVADAVGVFSGRVQHTIEDFKEFVESRGRETGAWRGEVRDGRRQGDGASRVYKPGDAAREQAFGSGAAAGTTVAGGEQIPAGGTALKTDPNVNAPGTGGKHATTAATKQAGRQSQGHMPGHAEEDVPNDAWPFQQDIKKP
jgi:hypothetical protein